MLHARFDHLREPLLQDHRVGRGAIGDEALISGTIFNRADESDRFAGSVENRLEHFRGRRFSRGAGDADERELLRWPAIEIRGDQRERGTRVIDFDVGGATGS